ncbi:LysE family translocator [Denitromonas sp.]|uniref:LysE family translocator n=1 Tax=Denitromonas sp. TaxID=2734609 RepID=UPI002AFF5923|nr:LysE family translocator [Denitromonas sp.]
MPSPDTLIAFLGIALIITFAPGPDNLMVLGQSLARGRMAGFGIAVGCALGCFTHVLWATLGVSAALAASPAAFTALKLAGAAYLAWLGVQALRSGGQLTVDAKTAGPRPWRKDVGRGFIANAINPKVALFFLAFMPQFVQAGAGNTTLQMLVLGLVFMAQTVVVFGTVAYLAGSIGRLLKRRPGVAPWLDRIAGMIFLGLALRLVLDDTQG